jgi:uncharacterized membrane protein YdjX (TVP38/TMEM64 family)
VIEMRQTPDLPPKPKLLRHLPLMVIALVAILGVFLLRDQLTFEVLRDNRAALIAFRDSHLLQTVGLFCVTYILIVGFSLPGATVASLAGGLLFGTLWGTAINIFNATCGATLIFLAARSGLGELLRARMDTATGKVHAIKRGIDENQWSMLFLIRLLPAVPFFVANLIPAFLGVPLYRFVISTMFGIVPGTLVVTSIGAGLGEVIDRGESPDFSIFFEPHILFPILGLIALALLPVALKYLHGKKDLMP